MGFYVNPDYLEVIHYYYFSIGMFSFMCSIIFSFSAVFSIIFILLYVGQSSFSWYISWYMQKKMRELVILNSLRFMMQHVVMTFFVGGMTFLLWYFSAFSEQSLIATILQVNYFVFFMAFIWYLIVRVDVVKVVFDVYDSRKMESAKNLVIRVRESRSEIFTKRLMTNYQIKNYRIGSNPEIDEMLIGAWSERRSARLLKRIAQLELAMCAWMISRLKKYTIRQEGEVPRPAEIEAAAAYAKLIEEYTKSSMEYEKVVASKIPEE